MRFRVNSADDVEFSFGDQRSPFEFVFDAGALRTYLTLGAEALAQMDALKAKEQAASTVEAPGAGPVPA